MTDESELRKIDGWIINLTKLSSFEDTISSSSRKESSAGATASSNSNLKVNTNQAQISPLATSSTNPLANLSIIDVMQNSSLASMTRILAASNGTISLKLDKLVSEFSIDNLKPFTVYQIQMFAFNSLGRSQLTDPIRALTLSPESEPSGGVSDSKANANNEDLIEPNLPDTRKCCEKRGVTLKK